MNKKTQNTEDLDENVIAEDVVEDVVFEDTDAEGAATSDKEKIKKLKEEIKELQAKNKEYLDGWQRARADLVNKDKQIAEDRLDIIKRASSRLIEEILPTLDSFEMAKKNKEVWEKVDSGWRMGVEYIFSNLENVLSGEGLNKVVPNEGDAFDVNTMQAVEEVETADASKDHLVAAVIQSGYSLSGKLLREAKVKVFVKK